MTEKSSHRTSTLSEKIPEETRQHYRKSRQEMREALGYLLPEGFIEHRRAARKEMLLALRSLLDDALNRMDKESK